MQNFCFCSSCYCVPNTVGTSTGLLVTRMYHQSDTKVLTSKVQYRSLLKCITKKECPVPFALSAVVHFQCEYFLYRTVSPKWYGNTYDGRYSLTRLWNVSPKKKVRNCKKFVSPNPTVAYQMQLGLALADSLLERIAKVIQKC